MPAYNKLLVTGHLGFIGSNFCEMFRDRYEIVGVDFAGWGSMERNLGAGVRDIRADIADSDQVRAIVEEVRPDAIINFAAESHNDRANQDDASFWRSNLHGVRNLALAACLLHARFVQVSTDEVKGDAISNTEPWTEESPMTPRNAYAVTKASAEMLLRVYSTNKEQNLDVVITRGANTIGPRQFPEKAVPKAISCFLTGRPFPLFPTPARRMWMHVEDHVAGIEAALRCGKQGEVYNLAPAAASEAFTEDVIARVRDLVGQGQIEKTKKDRPNYDLRYLMDTSKAGRELDWRARYDLEQTLRSTVTWYLANLDWLKEANKKLAGGG